MGPVVRVLLTVTLVGTYHAGILLDAKALLEADSQVERRASMLVAGA